MGNFGDGEVIKIIVDENGDFVGGVSKFLQERKELVCAALHLKKGDFVGLTAGKRLDALKTAGVLRKFLGNICPAHMKQECYEFCWIVDFPMYEIGEESGELEFCHNPFPCPREEWMPLRQKTLLIFTLTSMTWSATAWNSPPALCVTMTRKSW